MRIVALIDGGGPAYHRIYTPLANMTGGEFDISFPEKLTEEMCKEGIDVVAFNRIPPRNVLSEVLRWKREYGFKTWVDLDDHWELDPHHILFEYYRQYRLSEYILLSVRDADIVTVTHERLAQAVAEHNRNVWVLPNAIPPDFEQFAATRPTPHPDAVRLFWAGGVTHERDLALLRGPLRRVHGDKQLRDRVAMVLAGFHPGEPAWHSMASAYTYGMKLRGTIINGLPVAEYYTAYQHADICLVPLVASRFNANKSNLKILEAANAGLPVVVSMVNPYLGFPADLVCYVGSQPDWYYHIRRLVNDAGLRQRQGQLLQQYCREVYHFGRINESRAQMLRSLKA